MVLSFQYACVRGWQVNKAIKQLAIFLGLMSVYMLVQRYWGINWVHGFGSKLAENRYAYGVYRACGFMAHPLSMGYNLMVLTLLCLGLGLRQLKLKKQSKFWLISSFYRFFAWL